MKFLRKEKTVLWEYNEHINYLELPYNATILPNVSYEISKHFYLLIGEN